MNQHLKGDNECPDISINIKGRIYAVKLTETQITERTRRFLKETGRINDNTPIEWIKRRGTKKFLLLCYGYIEDLFGDGLCERYFGAGRCNTEEMMKLLGFILGELEKQREKSLN